jgi:hypothetical protein
LVLTEMQPPVVVSAAAALSGDFLVWGRLVGECVVFRVDATQSAPRRTGVSQNRGR